MSKSTRSISLPARAGALNDRTREVKTALKNSENLRRTEKENEIERCMEEAVSVFAWIR